MRNGPLLAVITLSLEFYSHRELVRENITSDIIKFLVPKTCVHLSSMFTVRNKVHKVETRVCAETNMKYFANPVRKGMIIGDVCLGDRPPWLKLRRTFLSDKVKGLVSLNCRWFLFYVRETAQLISSTDPY